MMLPILTMPTIQPAHSGLAHTLQPANLLKAACRGLSAGLECASLWRGNVIVRASKPLIAEVARENQSVGISFGLISSKTPIQERNDPLESNPVRVASV